MPFVLVIIGLLGGLQIYFFGVADRAQKSVAAQVLLSRSTKNVNQEVYLEQLLTVQVQELMRREAISALDLEKGVSSIVNEKNPDNPAEDQSSVLFKPTKSAKSAAEQLTEFREMLIGDQKYRVKAIGSSLPRDPTGYVDLAVCPVKAPGTEEIDTRNPKKVRVRLSVKSGFLNAVTGNTMYNVFFPGEIFGNVAEFGTREWGNQWLSTRIYGRWLGTGPLNETVTAWDGWPYNIDGGDESKTPMSSEFFTANEGPRREFNVMSIAEMESDPYFRPRAIDGKTINTHRYQPWSTWRWWAFALEGTEGHYDGPELPWNPNTRSRSLPKFNPDMARLLARGEIAAGKPGAVQFVPYGGTWSGRETMDSISPDAATGLTTVDGNLVLDGRDVAFRICGRVFVSGDIIVMGKYSTKTEGGEPCPSTLIAGRNIYVADNLVANERAGIFDKTVQANVDRLAKISDPKVAREVAEEIWSADQLVLLATNNLVMGNPFPFGGTFKDVGGRRFIVPSISNETSVMAGWSALAKYQDLLSYHKSTGVLGQPNLIGGDYCMTLPWENVELTCRTRTADGGFASNDRFIKVPMNEDTWLREQNVADAYLISSNFYIPEGYWKLFLPMNVKDRASGELGPWISELEFRAAVRNLADYNMYAKPDQCGRRNVLLNTSLPFRQVDVLKDLPSYDAPFVRKADPALILDEVDKATGFIEKYGDYEVEYSEVQSQGKLKVRDAFLQGIQLCLERAKASEDSNPSYERKSPYLAPKKSDGTPLKFADLTDSVQKADLSTDDIECNQDRHNPKKPGRWDLTWSSAANSYVKRPFYSPTPNYYSYAAPSFATGDLIDPLILDERELNSRSIDFTPTWAIHKPTYPEAYLHVRCNIGFYVAQKTPTCDPAVPVKLAYSNDVNFWEGPGYLPETDGATYCNLSPDVQGDGSNMSRATCARQLIALDYYKCDNCYASGTFNATACKPSGKKMYFWNNAPSGLPPNEYSFYGPDLMLKLYYDDGAQLHAEVDSRFLDGDVSAAFGARANVLQNRVKEVDGYLFANQFLAHLGETVHDRQVQVNGGIAGRDFLGLLQSKVGPYRPNYDTTDATAAFRTWYAGREETGIIVAWDPRFRYAEDIMQSDVGSSELTENSSEVVAACKDPAAE